MLRNITNLILGSLMISGSAMAQCTISGETSPVCPNSAVQTLSTTGNSLLGPGVSGNTFDPSIAGLGTHTIEAYSNNYGYTVFQGGTFDPTPSVGTAVTLADDQVSGALPVGFTFNFFGNDYTDFYISSNGFISFDPAVSQGCCQGLTIPTADIVNNAISYHWNDLNPSSGGTIEYSTIGVAPQRKLIVTFTGIPHFGNNALLNTAQIVLNESSNIVEIHSTEITDDGSSVGTQGIEDASGTNAHFVTGRNAAAWSVTNDGVAFKPFGGSVCATTTIVVEDLSAPVPDLASLPDLPAACQVNEPNYTATDLCAGSITGVPDVTFPITTQGTTVVTWTYDDGNGNISTQTQNVIITDIDAPVADVATLNDVTECFSATPTAPTATDLCAGSIAGVPDVTFPITAQGTTLVTWTYDDGNGNTSTQTQNVIINTVDVGVSQSGITLAADAVGATYQWLDCDNGYAPIAGETNVSFTPSAIVGNYAVEVTENGCVDTSACTVIDYTGIEDLEQFGISIFPNPSTGKFSIDSKSYLIESVKVLDSRGRLVRDISQLDETNILMDISDEKPGVYFVQVSGEFGTSLNKIVLK